MVSNVDSTQASGAPLPERLDRHDAEARQGRWMLELERAMLSSDAKKRAGAQATKGPLASAMPWNASMEPAGTVPQQATSLTGAMRPAGIASTQAGRPTAQMAIVSGARPLDVRALETGQVATGATPLSPQTAVRPEIVDPDVGHRGGTLVTQACNHDDSVFPLPAAEQGRGAMEVTAGTQTTAHMPARATDGGSDVTSDVLVQTYLATAPEDGDGPALASGNVPGQAVTERTVAMLPGALEQGPYMSPTKSGTVTLALQDRQFPLPDDEPQALPAVEAQPQSDGGDGRLAEAPDIDKRLMHLFMRTDGVHAFIRDAELNAAQVRSVANMLAAQMAGSGQLLAALTVNGRRIVSGPAHPRAEDAIVAPEDEPTAPTSVLQTLSSVRKGTPE